MVDPVKASPSSKYSYTCTCPDFTQSKEALLWRRSWSETTDQDWTDSTTTGPREGICKHIYAVLRQENDDYTIPRDVTLDSLPNPAMQKTSLRFRAPKTV